MHRESARLHIGFITLGHLQLPDPFSGSQSGLLSSGAGSCIFCCYFWGRRKGVGYELSRGHLEKLLIDRIEFLVREPYDKIVAWLKR